MSEENAQAMLAHAGFGSVDVKHLEGDLCHALYIARMGTQITGGGEA